MSPLAADDAGPPSDPQRPGGAARAPLDTTEPVAVLGRAAPSDPAERWLVALRWIATLGMAATIAVADRFVDGLHVVPMAVVLGAIALTNVGWMIFLRRVPRKIEDEERRWVEPQLIVDVVLLTAMLWFAGGVTNPFAAFMTFQIALAGLLCTARATALVASLTIAAVGVLTLAPPLPPLSPALGRLAAVVSLTTLTALLSAFVAISAQRLDQLRRWHAQSEKLATLGRLVGSMSHELNTPLSTILLLARDLEQFGGDMSQAEAQEVVRSIHEEAQRGSRIIGLVRGHVVPDEMTEPVDLGRFVRDFAQAELDRLAFQGERIYRCEEGLVAQVVTPALGQVLVNVLRNAAEASVLGRRRRITIEVERAGDAAEVRVEDRGPGFSPEILARLGEPFQTTKQGGMGLGLYLSGELARQMGSALRVQTVPGGGARVTLSIDLPRPGRASRH
jgi:two-component system sensor histidine kinase RegB